MNAIVPSESLVGPSVRYVDRDMELEQYSTVEEWSVSARAVHDELMEFLGRKSESELLPTCRLDTPSLKEMVDQEIARYVSGEIEIGQVRPFSEISSERDRMVEASGLPSLELRKFFESPQQEETVKQLRVQLPHANIVRSDAQPPLVGDTGVEVHTVVSFQVYSSIHKRETKLLGIDMHAEQTVEELFNAIVEHMPELKMFDGPNYAGTGLVILGGNLYRLGNEDYSLPYSVWLEQYNVNHCVYEMSPSKISHVPDLPRMCANSNLGFLQYCGNEVLKLVVSGISLRQAGTQYPALTYKRRLPRSTKCGLCTSSLADLVVLNDLLLPRNPTHCCGDCYRRLRSNKEGEFIEPPSDVIVSPFFSI